MSAAIATPAAAAVKRKSRKSVFGQLMTDADEYPPASSRTAPVVTAAAKSSNGIGEPARRTSAGRRTHSTAGAAAAASERLQPSVPMRIGGGRVKKARVPFDPSEETGSSRRRRTTLGGEQSTELPMAPPPPQPKPQQPQPQPSTTKAAAEPSEQRPPKKRRSQYHEQPTPVPASSPQPSPPKSGCGLCQPNGAGAATDRRPFSVCTQCKYNRVHVECYRSENSEHYSRTEATSWQCDDCLTCTHCYESTIIGPIYKCYICFSNYHAECNLLNGRIVRPAHIVQHNRFQCAHCALYDSPYTTAAIAAIRPKPTVAAVDTAAAAPAQKPRIIKRKTLVTGFLGFVAKDLRSVRSQPEQTVPEQADAEMPAVQVANADAELAADVVEPPTQQPEIDFDSQSKGEDEDIEASVAVVDAAPSSPLSPATSPSVELVDLTPDNGDPDVYEVIDIDDDDDDDVKAADDADNAADADEDIAESGNDSVVRVDDDILTIDADRVRPTRTTAELIGQLVDSQISVRSSQPLSPEEQAPIDRAQQRRADAAAVAAETSLTTAHAAATAAAAAAAAAEPSFPVTVITSNHANGNFMYRATLTSTEPWSPYGRCASDIVPDASDWSVDDVHAYFAKCLPAAADVLREEEVDGCALLLLKRTDVLELPGISMGARLNVYTHCVRLQTRSNDVRKAYA